MSLVREIVLWVCAAYFVLWIVGMLLLCWGATEDGGW